MYNEKSDAIKQTLQITRRLIEAAAPPETYWPRYHAKLREKLEQAREPHVAPSGPSWLTRFFASSVRVPAPAVLALMLMFVLTAIFAIRPSQQNDSQPQIVTVPIEVPVIQEKTVTRVVYRQRRALARRTKETISPSRSDSTLAKSQAPASLVGFKPTDDVKLTVIKGGSPNEK